MKIDDDLLVPIHVILDKSGQTFTKGFGGTLDCVENPN
jgi:hypothetical protein